MSELKSICFATDISGSTSLTDMNPMYVYKYKARSEIIQELCLDIAKAVGMHNLSFVGWSAHLRNLTFEQFCSKRYYNELSFIRPNTTRPVLLVKPEYMKHDVLVFVTDGEIEKEDVQKMVDEVKTQEILPAAILCVIVSPRKPTPDAENISVFSALMTRPSIIIHNDGKDTVQLWDNLGITDGDVPKTWINAPTVNLPELMNILLNVQYINNDSISLPNGLIINDEKLFSMSNDELIKLLPYWRTIVFQQSIRNRKRGLKDLRKLVNDTLSMTVDLNSLLRLRMDICKQLKTDPSLRSELNKIDLDIETLTAKNHKYVKAKSEMLAILHEYDSTTTDFSLKSVSSNRAARASVVENFPLLQDLETSCKDKIHGECTICLADDDGLWILLREGDHKDNTDDFVLDFPMAYDVFHQLCPDLVCYHCSVAMVNQGQDHYRQPIVGAVPMINKFPDNPSILHRAISAWLFGRSLHVGWHIFINSLIGIIYRNPDMLNVYGETLKCLATSVKTNDKFKGEGDDKVTFATAVTNILTDSLESMRQPLNALVRLVSLMRMIGVELEPTSIQQMLDDRTVKHVIEIYRTKLTKAELCQYLFERGSGMLYDVNHIKDAAIDEFNIDLPDIMLDDKTVVNLNKILSHSILHRIQEALLLVFKDGNRYKTDDLFIRYMTEDSLFDKIFNRKVDDVHYNPPPFITIFGPSLKKCSCGYTGSLDEMSNHFSNIYGSISPNRKSIHSNIHRTVQVYFKEHVPDKMSRTDLIGILKLLYKDGIGNIWISHIPTVVAQVGTSFIETYKRSSEADKEMFHDMFKDHNSHKLHQFMSRENRLMYENKLGVGISHQYYYLPTVDPSLLEPINDKEFEELKNNLPLPLIFENE
jgi:hypothetical protein